MIARVESGLARLWQKVSWYQNNIESNVYHFKKSRALRHIQHASGYLSQALSPRAFNRISQGSGCDDAIISINGEPSSPSRVRTTACSDLQ